MPYYIKNRGKAFGPFNEQQLIELKMKGKISRNADVSEDQTNWFTAENLQFLGFTTPQQISDGGTSSSPANATATNESPEWFYSTDGNAGYGPVTETAIRQMLQKGTLTGNSYVWKQGAMAQAIKTVPEFDNNSNWGSQPIQTPIVGKLSGGPTDILQPLSQSLNWLMFLKILYLIVLVVIISVLLCGHIWGLSVSIGTNRPLPIIVALLLFAIEIALCYLQVMAFLSFWKYHSSVLMFTLIKNENILFAANDSLYKFWRWTAMWIIGEVGTISITLLTVFAISGFNLGRLVDLFGG